MKNTSSTLESASLSGRIAVLGDIHSNLEALEAVIEDANKQQVNHLLCTGDIIGYGADPSACIQYFQEMRVPVVKGNHDHYCSDEQVPANVSKAVHASMQWTKKQLNQHQLIWVRKLPLQLQFGDIAFTHSTFEPVSNWPYILDDTNAEASMSAQPSALAFYGHTHRPIVFTQTPTGKITSQELTEIKLNKQDKFFINPGSVGQPRDGDPRAAYAIVDLSCSVVTLRRINYSVETTAMKILKAGLPERNASRLFLGR